MKLHHAMTETCLEKVCFFSGSALRPFEGNDSAVECCDDSSGFLQNHGLSLASDFSEISLRVEEIVFSSRIPEVSGPSRYILNDRLLHLSTYRTERRFRRIGRHRDPGDAATLIERAIGKQCIQIFQSTLA